MKRGNFFFAGLVKCADCGSSLNLSYDAKKQKFKNLSCWVYKNYGKERCTSHAIGWQTLNHLVLEGIQRNAEIAKKAMQKYMDSLVAMKTEKPKKEVAKYKREVHSAEKRIAELDKILSKLYEDNALSKVSDERYQSMSGGYEAEQSALKTRCKELLAEVEKADEVYANAENFTSLIRQYTDVTELNAKILNELIGRIIVHEKTTNEDGSKSQRVDIYYKFIGYLSMEGWCQAVRLEDTAENPVQMTA